MRLRTSTVATAANPKPSRMTAMSQPRRRFGGGGSSMPADGTGSGGTGGTGAESGAADGDGGSDIVMAHPPSGWPTAYRSLALVLALDLGATGRDKGADHVVGERVVRLEADR